MKIKNYLLSAMILLIAVSSCSKKEEDKFRKKDKLVTFNSRITNQDIISSLSPLKTSDGEWKANDAIGVFMKVGPGLTTIIDGAENKKYTTSGDGIFTPATSNDDIFFPSTDAVDFIAYYPYSSSITDNIYKVDVANQESQEAIDLLYSDNVTGEKENDNTQLNFTHELSKVVFNVIATAPITNLDDFSISITDVPTKADYNLSDKSLTVDETKSDITIKTTVSGLLAVSEAILIPTAATDRKFVFSWKINDEIKTYEWDASNQEFQKGKKNVYNITLKKSEILISPNTSIIAWENGSSEDIEIDIRIKDVEGPTVIFSESFGEFVVPEESTSTIPLETFAFFDMGSPIQYSTKGTTTIIRSEHIRFPDNGYYLTFDGGQNRIFAIENIESENYTNLSLSFDFATGNADININELILKCNGQTIALPSQTITNRDRFQPISSAVSIPDGTTEIELEFNSSIVSFIRLDNIKIAGKVK